jgi:phospholipid/cholesterol/gamma-HCH transport system substrate-binding protein
MNQKAAKTIEQDFKVGVFVTLGLVFCMLAILVLGGTDNLFTPQNTYHSYFPETPGLVPGAKVVLNGVTVGTVRSVELEKGKPEIKVEYRVVTKYKEWVREGTFVEILTQGVLGDKYLALTSSEAPGAIYPENSTIPTKKTQDFTAMLNKGDQLMMNLNSLVSGMDRLIQSFEKQNRSDLFFQSLAQSARNVSQLSAKLNQELEGMELKKASRELSQILAKINQGQGTLGALINDPELYDEARSLMGGVNRNRIMRNLVRKSVKEGSTKPE